jgi:hypothetical protein
MSASALAQDAPVVAHNARRAALRVATPPNTSDVICTSGTCVPECGLYGWCHCGCGAAATKADCSNAYRGYVGGRYFRYLWQHFRPTNPYDGDKCGVPYSEVRGMVAALLDELGLYEAAKRVGMSARCVSMWHNDHMAHVQRRSAAKIESAYNSMDYKLRLEKLPTEPMRNFLVRSGQTPETAWPPSHRFRRYCYRPTVSTLNADEMAVSLGAHPSEIWPNWWEMETA